MKKLVVMSILLTTFAIPMLAARSASAVQGIRRTFVGMALFLGIYVLLVTTLH